MKKILLVDFFDSFTYNIASQIHSEGRIVEVVPYDQIDPSIEYSALIFGPGPGHPDDYQNFFPMLTHLLKKPIPFLGICLGHQIFWQFQGAKVVKSSHPSHGKKHVYPLNQDWKKYFQTNENEITVQRYNSLAVTDFETKSSGFMLMSEQKELIMSAKGRIITYQFHPESIGTNYRKMFFHPFLAHLKL